MTKNYRYTISIIFVSIFIITFGFWMVGILYSDVAESIGVIETAQAIQKSPEMIQEELISLGNQKINLQNRLTKFENKKSPDLNEFQKIAKENDLKLTGVNLKRKMTVKQDQNKRYQLTFTGRITSALDALNQIENESILWIESINMVSNDADNKLIDFGIMISIPE